MYYIATYIYKCVTFLYMHTNKLLLKQIILFAMHYKITTFNIIYNVHLHANRNEKINKWSIRSIILLLPSVYFLGRLVLESNDFYTVYRLTKFVYLLHKPPKFNIFNYLFIEDIN